MLAIGYGIAMISSVIGGLAWDAGGSPAFAFIPVTIAVLSIVVVPLLTDFSDRSQGERKAAAR